jgi:hypothetical protein
MESLLCDDGLLYNGDGDLKGAQTVRRFGAGPVGSLLGRKDPTGRLSNFGFWIRRVAQASLRAPAYHFTSSVL